jgi:hypothetical protein
LRGFTPRKPDEYHCGFVRDGCAVELHFGLAPPTYFRFDHDGIWNRSRPGDFQGAPVHSMSNADLALYLCCHGIKHKFSRLILILDFARSLEGWADRDYEELMRRAQRQGMTPWLMIGCEIVRAMFPRQMPEALDALIAASPGKPKVARRAAERLLAGELEGCHPHDYRALYLAAELSVIRRWKYRLRVLAPTAPDYAWAKRWRIDPRLMTIIRPFRMLRKYGPARLWRSLFPPQA